MDYGTKLCSLFFYWPENIKGFYSKLSFGKFSDLTEDVRILSETVFS